MRYRWLIALLCLTMTACGKDGDSGNDADKDKAETAEVETKPATKLAKAEPKVEKETPKVESKPEAEVAQPTTKVESKPEAEVAQPTPKAESKPEAEDPPVLSFESQSKKFDDAMASFMTLYRAADAEGRRNLMKDLPKADDYAKDMLTIAAGDPESDEAFDSLLWVVQKARSGNSYDTAMDRLTTNFIDREELKSICIGLGYAQPSAKIESLINCLIEKSPHDSVQGTAMYAKAIYLKRAQTSWKRIKDSEDDQQEELLAYLESLDAGPMALETLYQTLIDDYGDIQPSETRKSTLKDLGSAALFEMNNLAIGMKVPEIEGEDIEGVEFKLSDYRGKVVVIDFWGDW